MKAKKKKFKIGKKKMKGNSSTPAEGEKPSTSKPSGMKVSDRNAESKIVDLDVKKKQRDKDPIPKAPKKVMAFKSPKPAKSKKSVREYDRFLVYDVLCDTNARVFNPIREVSSDC